ncbi:SMC-Scp complex subunit ScpB [Albibacterium indicum]|uniref:SMC-Scp complex subunit ScpB n=1 Tax=Albibacterium indicum TaxID=2292082 RepID=UPI000E5404AD|nr:SMC-Scp complex subunit ScpB [Pedobacter indicus]
MIEQVEQQIEALIFASEQSISTKEIKEVLNLTFESELSIEEIDQHIDTIEAKYAEEQFAFGLVRINGGFQFLSKAAYYPVINQLQIHRSKKKLSQAALETLAIIAYREPITKLEVEQIRGVNCDYSVRMLLEKELITILGKADSVGRPLLYGVSPLFQDYFGINSKSDLPKLKDVISEENFIGSSEE